MDLSHNRIYAIGDFAFDKLNSLKDLHINDNAYQLEMKTNSFLFNSDHSRIFTFRNYFSITRTHDLYSLIYSIIWIETLRWLETIIPILNRCHWLHLLNMIVIWHCILLDAIFAWISKLKVTYFNISRSAVNLYWKAIHQVKTY